MLNLLPLLLAKAGAATITTKVVVAGAVSAAALGTAGATGVVPVDALLPGDGASIVVPDQRSDDDVLAGVEDEVTDTDAQSDDSQVADDNTPERAADRAAEEAGEEAREAAEETAEEAREAADEAREQAELAAEQQRRSDEEAAEQQRRSDEEAAEQQRRSDEQSAQG